MKIRDAIKMAEICIEPSISCFDCPMSNNDTCIDMILGYLIDYIKEGIERDEHKTSSKDNR